MINLAGLCCLIGIVVFIFGLAISDPLFPIVTNEKTARKLTLCLFLLSVILCVAGLLLVLK
jgi:hypothetical protein